MTKMYPDSLRGVIKAEIVTVSENRTICLTAIKNLDSIPNAPRAIHEIKQQINRIAEEWGDIRSYLEGLEQRVGDLAIGIGGGKGAALNDFALTPYFNHDLQKGI